MSSARPDLFISADIETDGPIPGDFSMLSFALTPASTWDGQEFRTVEMSRDSTLYMELAPISDNFQEEALEVNGLDRERLSTEGTSPAEAMAAADEWVRSLADGHRPVLVAYPIAFDWAFLYWYFIRFVGDSPFGFSSCLDIRTLYQARALTPFDYASRASMPEWLQPASPHTHHAADDAIEQGELFNNVFAWALRGGGRGKRPALNQSAPEWLEQPLNPFSNDNHAGSLNPWRPRNQRKRRWD